MPETEPFFIFTRKLEEAGLAYMVSGSVAATFYGEPRMTNDVDVILFLGKGDLGKLEAAFPDDEFYRPPSEIIAIESARSQRGHFNLIHHPTGFKADIYPVSDALHRWGMAHARKVIVGGDTLSIAPPEYVIVRKLQFFREGGSVKHLRDIKRMLMAFGEDWNDHQLLSFIAEYRLQDEWKKAVDCDE